MLIYAFFVNFSAFWPYFAQGGISWPGPCAPQALRRQFMRKVPPLLLHLVQTVAGPCTIAEGTLVARVAGAGASEAGFPAGADAAGVSSPELHFVIYVGVQIETLAIGIPAIYAHDKIVSVTLDGLRS